jgi:hypothetical protein
MAFMVDSSYAALFSLKGRPKVVIEGVCFLGGTVYI